MKKENNLCICRVSFHDSRECVCSKDEEKCVTLLPTDIKLCIGSHYIKVIVTHIIWCYSCQAACELEERSPQATFPALFTHLRPRKHNIHG